MRILLTGGAGFVGTNVVSELLKENHEVIIIDKYMTIDEIKKLSENEEI